MCEEMSPGLHSVHGGMSPTQLARVRAISILEYKHALVMHLCATFVGFLGIKPATHTYANFVEPVEPSVDWWLYGSNTSRATSLYQ